MKAFSPPRTLLRLLGAFAVIFTAAQFDAAQAVTLAPGTILPGAVSYEYFGLNFANNIKTSDTVGTLNYGGQPGCGGTCVATTALGSSPSVSATVNEVAFAFTSGGGVAAKLGYYMAYYDAPGSYTVNLHATDSLSSPHGQPISAYLGFGPAADNTSRFNNFASTTFQEADCLNGCPAPGFAFPVTGTFVPDHLLSIEANTLYYIELSLLLNPTDDNIEMSAMIDPTFSGGSPTGHFAFSPGVFSASAAVTPIPAALPLFASGLGGLGLFGWFRKRAAAPARRLHMLALQAA